MNLVEAAKSANHCQRNWIDQVVNDETISALTEIAVNMPTKQNQNFYKLVVSTDTDYNHFVYLNGYDKEHCLVQDLPFEDRHLSNRNTQLLAPLLFQWVFSEEEFSNAVNTVDKSELKNGIGHLSVGISAGAVALAANALGLKTGFCSCLDMKNVTDKLSSIIGQQLDGTLLTLGIGYPREDMPHNFCVRPDGKLVVQQIYNKNIEVYRI